MMLRTIFEVHEPGVETRTYEAVNGTYDPFGPAKQISGPERTLLATEMTFSPNGDEVKVMRHIPYLPGGGHIRRALCRDSIDLHMEYGKPGQLMYWVREQSLA